MAFYRQKKTSTFKKEDQIKWKNTTHEATFDPFQKYFAVIKINNKSYLTEYISQFRSEAVAIFNEEARLYGGIVETVGVFKK
jgi:hypothetical protein